MTGVKAPSQRYHFRSIAGSVVAVTLPGEMKSFFCLSLLGGCLTGTSALATMDYLVDQAHDWPGVIEATHSLVAYPSVTQEFTPAFGALDVVEVYTRDWSFPVTNGIGATLQVSIREDTTNGAILAASAPLELPDGWEGPSQFLFANLVWLTPGKRYAIEVELLEGNNWGVDSYGTFAPPYDGGRYFVGPYQINGKDMWFRTGVRVPNVRLILDRQRVVRWTGIPPLTYRVWSSTDLVKWSHAGFVQSETPDYAFTNNAGAATSLFYKVSLP